MSNNYYHKAKGYGINSGVGTNAGVTVATTAVAGTAYTCSGIDASGDAAALVTIESPAGTVVWRKRFAAAFNTSAYFEPGCIKGIPGDLIQVKISASTTNCEASINWIKI